jgi:hypothetical protein
MAAIRMECDNSITVLVDPLENNTIKNGVFLTRSYKNPSGVLPEEHIFISNNEQWFYWLGYNKDFQKEVPDTIENNDIIEKIFDYINEFSSGRQLDIALQEHCHNCSKQDTLYCQTTCNYGAI